MEFRVAFVVIFFVRMSIEFNFALKYTLVCLYVVVSGKCSFDEKQGERKFTAIALTYFRALLPCVMMMMFFSINRERKRDEVRGKLQ